MPRTHWSSSVPSPAVLRAGAVLDDATEIPGGVQTLITVTFEVEGASKPACVATIVLRHYE